MLGLRDMSSNVVSFPIYTILPFPAVCPTVYAVPATGTKDGDASILLKAIYPDGEPMADVKETVIELDVTSGNCILVGCAGGGDSIVDWLPCKGEVGKKLLEGPLPLKENMS